MNTGNAAAGKLPALYRVPSQSVPCTVAAKSRIEHCFGDPLFLADWDEPVFLHFEIDPEILQPHIPFPLDTRNGKAYITLVAFTMRNMRFRKGGDRARALTKPIANHSFLNLRTYVIQNGEPGIHFICEWLNSRLATTLGPVTFGLPYRFGEIKYDHNYTDNTYRGTVRHGNRTVSYEATSDPDDEWKPCESGTLDEFLLERYTAFTARWKWKGLFRVWHHAWPQKRLTKLKITDLSLLETAPGAGKWVSHLKPVGGNVSTGADDVWMSRPHLK